VTEKRTILFQKGRLACQGEMCNDETLNEVAMVSSGNLCQCEISTEFVIRHDAVDLIEFMDVSTKNAGSPE
jgi:hypothetical protein